MIICYIGVYYTNKLDKVKWWANRVKNSLPEAYFNI